MVKAQWQNVYSISPERAVAVSLRYRQHLAQSGRLRQFGWYRGIISSQKSWAFFITKSQKSQEEICTKKFLRI